MKNKADWKIQLDECQEEYKTIYSDRKTGVNMHQSGFNRIFEKVLLNVLKNENAFIRHMQKSVVGGWLSDDDYQVILMDVLEKFKNHYDPFAGKSIYGYIFDHCRWLALSRVDKMAGINKAKDTEEEKREKYSRIPISFTQIEEMSYSQDKYGDVFLENEEESLNYMANDGYADEDDSDDVFLEFSAIVLDFTKNHNRKTGSSQRRLLYELFYSTDIINYAKDVRNPDTLRHERVVMSAMHIPYSNFCTALPNQYDERYPISIQKIRKNKLKTVGELAPSSATPPNADEEAKAPLKNQPILGYMEKVERSVIDDQRLSQQKAKFYEEVCPIFKKRRLL